MVEAFKVIDDQEEYKFTSKLIDNLIINPRRRYYGVLKPALEAIRIHPSVTLQR